MRILSVRIAAPLVCIHSPFIWTQDPREGGGVVVVRRANVGELRGKTSAAEGLRENGSQGENNGWCDSHASGNSSVLCACRSLNS